MTTYALVRIIGNELPPRDSVGNRIKSLKFILEHEPKFDACTKIWIINQIHCPSLKDEILLLLKDHQIVNLDFNVCDFKKAISFDEKVIIAININKARNLALDLAKDYRFTFVFDGDCFFTNDLWETTINQIESDQLIHDRKYYGVPGIRIVNEIPIDLNDYKKWEPSIIFRNDAELRFNEGIPFGKQDRLELMKKIGYTSFNGNTILTGDLCKNVGGLLHISFNEPKSEFDLNHRMKLRETALKLFIDKIKPSSISFL